MRRALLALVCAFGLSLALAVPAQASYLYRVHCSPKSAFGHTLSALDMYSWVHRGTTRGNRWTRPWATPTHTTVRWGPLPDVHYRFAFFTFDGGSPRGYEHPLYRWRYGATHTLTAHWIQNGGGKFSCSVVVY